MKKIENIAAWITAVCTAIVLLYGGYMFFRDTVIEANKRQENNLIVLNAMNDLAKSDSIRNVQLNRILDSLNTVIKSQKSIENKHNRLNASFVKHLKNAEKVDELINFYELDKK